MSLSKKIVKNTGYILVGNIVFRILSLIITIYLARYLGVEGFGKFNFINAYIFTFTILSSLGTEKIFIREMSRDKLNAPKLLGNGLIIRAGLSIVAILLSVILIEIFHYPKETIRYVYTTCIIILFISYSDYYTSIFHARLKMEYEAYSKILSKIIYVILIYIITLYNGTLEHILIALVFSEFVKLTLIYLFSLKIIRANFDIDFNICKYLLKEGLPIAITSIISAIYFSTDILMLSYMSGDASVGYYSAALKLSEPFLIISQAISMSLFPLLSRSFIESKDTLEKVYNLGLKVILVAILPIAVGIFLLSNRFVLLFFDSNFLNSVSTLKILIWSIFVLSLTSISTTLLVSMNKQKMNTIISASCLLINIILNYMLIPKLDFIGASLATLLTNIILFFMSFYFVSKCISKYNHFKSLTKILFSALLMGLYLYIYLNSNLFLIILTSGSIYISIIFLLKTFNKDEIAIFKKIFNFSKFSSITKAH